MKGLIYDKDFQSALNKIRQNNWNIQDYIILSNINVSGWKGLIRDVEISASNVHGIDIGSLEGLGANKIVWDCEEITEDMINWISIKMSRNDGRMEDLLAMALKKEKVGFPQIKRFAVERDKYLTRLSERLKI